MFVIQWNLAPKSYYKGMSPIGPEFGASLNDTPKYSSSLEAGIVQSSFPLVALCGSLVVPVERSWICRGCGLAKYESWCWDCDIHESGKTFLELREEKAVWDLDFALYFALSGTRDPDKWPAA